MTLKYDVGSQGQSVAIAFLSTYGEEEKYIVATIVPIERSGKWTQGTLEISFGKSKSELLPRETSEVEAVNRLLTTVGIDPSGCAIAQVPLASNQMDSRA